MRELRCPRCDAEIQAHHGHCPFCHFILRNKESGSKKDSAIGATGASTTGSTTGSKSRWTAWKKGISFIGFPKFLQKEESYYVAETELPRAGWKAVFALLAAGAIVLAYRVPFGDLGQSLIHGFRGERSGGSVSIEVLNSPGRVRPTRWKFPDVPVESVKPQARVMKKPKRRASTP